MGYGQERPLRRLRRWLVRDWLEIGATGLGTIALLGFFLCSMVAVFLVVHFNDPERGFPTAGGNVSVLKGLGVLLFAAGAVVTFAVGWGLVGRRLVRGLGGVFGRSRAEADEGERRRTILLSLLLLIGAIAIGAAVFGPRETAARPDSGDETVTVPEGDGGPPSTGIELPSGTCHQCR